MVSVIGCPRRLFSVLTFKTVNYHLPTFLPSFATIRVDCYLQVPFVLFLRRCACGTLTNDDKLTLTLLQLDLCQSCSSVSFLPTHLIGCSLSQRLFLSLLIFHWPVFSLFSRNRQRMKQALLALAETPQNNLRICQASSSHCFNIILWS